ncbi:MAG: hypothetical protein OXR64_12265 [Chloroflexota bacterium]|nr:hypothetical protein [Chloroflexota bacterium]MDE2920599.1 hypothetical protein [Chloroflexota bacterium]
MNSDASTIDLGTDPLGFAIEALNDHTTPGASERVAAARRAWAVLDIASFPKASVDAARRLALGVRALVWGGQPVALGVALEAIEAAERWLESARPAEESSRADAQEARGVARRLAAGSGGEPDARMLEAAAMDLLAAAQYRQQVGDAEAAARTDLEIAEAFAVYPADDRAPLIERAVGHARRAAATLTAAVDATAHARCQLLLSGLLLDHPKTDPKQFAHAAVGLADSALKIVDAERAPFVAARAWRARARALELSGSTNHSAAYARAADLLSAAGLGAESRRLRRRHLCA